jgi:DNA modification methylase
VIHGDCLSVMPTLPAESVDAIVCDPPYGLSFMGKNWDHGIPGVAFWAAALRVAKPGAHLVAFGGTRTFHRLACAIEDAGWEIRDTLSWMYGSGFPKSLDVSKALDKAAGAAGEYGGPKSEAHAGWIERGKMRGDHGHEGHQRPWMDDPAAVDRNARQYLPATDAAKQWAGWGTALKPAWEPIILARKPLSGTVAQTVTQWGTGAINVDACRIGSDTIQTNRYTPGRDMTSFHGSQAGNEYVSSTHAGRWPANVVLSHSDQCREVGTREAKRNTRTGDHVGRGERTDGLRYLSNGVGNSTTSVPETVPAWICEKNCPVRLLDEQGGERKGGGKAGPRNTDTSEEYWGEGGGGYTSVGRSASFHHDTGGASRFFYTAKASRREREAGLEGMPQAKVTDADKWATNDRRSGTDRQPTEWRQSPVSNSHPTVKPLALMRWLCRLVTPPGGVILDPFTGSGSTGCAAVLEGFRFLGIEQEAEYVAIAERRIAHWAATVASATPDPDPQTELEVA